MLRRQECTAICHVTLSLVVSLVCLLFLSSFIYIAHVERAAWAVESAPVVPTPVRLAEPRFDCAVCSQGTGPLVGTFVCHACLERHTAPLDDCAPVSHTAAWLHRRSDTVAWRLTHEAAWLGCNHTTTTSDGYDVVADGAWCLDVIHPLVRQALVSSSSALAYDVVFGVCAVLALAAVAYTGRRAFFVLVTDRRRIETQLAAMRLDGSSSSTSVADAAINYATALSVSKMQ